MIIEFSVGNFRSIKDVQTLSMVAAPISSKYKELDEQNVFQATEKIRLVKTKAIYGANASGKSNIIKALKVFQQIILHSFKDENVVPESTDRFLLGEEKDLETPTFMQMIFIIDEVIYRYGFEYRNDCIISEWLYGRPAQKEVYYYVRDKNEIKFNDTKLKKISKLFNLSHNLLQKKSLILSMSHIFDSSILGSISAYVASMGIIYEIYRERAIQMVAPLLQYKESLDDISDILKFADTSIEKIEVFEVKNKDGREWLDLIQVKSLDENPFDIDIIHDILEGKRKFFISANHINRYRNNMVEQLDFEYHESEGTKKLLELSISILNSIQNGIPLIIDEFDSRFHPIISQRIVDLYNKNSSRAQFIFTTHDTNLLNAKLLRRDQIAFVEKDKYGASHLYDLVEFKGVRNDASFEKDYLDGRYGAIPFVGDFESIFNK
ncbi:AAA family ATPase [Emticicia agri]|uniref:ATP-binding protein n=1 Tax=Emticicia agri TaxID=2492393 RepID=A0A4Q5LUE5_9BACT|nr:ATP-binding protein [Emticicia agri]RYU93291.1 ATP-binding protein [Emticicia agri]